MSLGNILASLQAKEKEKAEFEKEKPLILKEWQDCLANLMDEVRDYLNEYEIGGKLSILSRQINLRDDWFGPYAASALTISAGEKVVLIDPLAVAVMGFAGRVDMYRQGQSAEHNGIALLRGRTSSTDPTYVWWTSTQIGPQRPVLQQPIRMAGRAARPQQAQQPAYVRLSKEIIENRLEHLLLRQ